MAVFTVIPIRPVDAQMLAKQVPLKFPGKFYKLPNGEFLVSYSGTSRALSDELGISDGATGHGVVAAMSGYYGHAPTDIWEWIKVNWESAK